MASTLLSGPWVEYFYQRSFRARVALSQLPLSIAAVIALVVAMVAIPDRLWTPWTMAAVGVQIVVLLASLTVPWQRLPKGSFLALPYLDLLSICFARLGAGNYQSNVAVLCIFPLSWLAASGLAKRTALLVSFCVPAIVVWTPSIVDGQIPTGRGLTNAALFPFIMLGMAATLMILLNSMAAQHRALLAKDKALRSALEASDSRQRLLDAVVNTVGVGIVALDADGKEILRNRKQHEFRAHAGDSSSEAGLLVFDLDQRTLLPAERRPLQRAKAGVAFEDELVWIGSPTDRRTLSVTARPVHRDDGGSVGSVVVFSDVTALVSALAAKDDFVSNVSHEFRTPLTSILGYLGLALEDPSLIAPNVMGYLQTAERNADRLLALVSDLLATTSNQLLLHPRAGDLAALVTDSLESAQPRAAENEVTLVNQTVGPLEAVLDISRMGQVLDNLVSNAIKYSPDGGVVTVRCFADGDSLVCHVTDTGLGMSQHDLAEAFTKFHRASAANIKGIPGIGLGLPITKAIVEGHGGTITLTSQLGEGTTVSFSIPLVDAPADAAVSAVT